MASFLLRPSHAIFTPIHLVQRVIVPLLDSNLRLCVCMCVFCVSMCLPVVWKITTNSQTHSISRARARAHTHTHTHTHTVHDKVRRLDGDLSSRSSDVRIFTFVLVNPVNWVPKAFAGGVLAIVILYLADGNLGLVFFNVLLSVMGFLSFLLTVILTFRTMPYAPLLYFFF